MTLDPIHLFVVGIGNYPGCPHTWVDHGVEWCNIRGILADKFKYGALPLSRFIMQGVRIKNLRKILVKYKDRPIHLVGHSNGCELLCEAIRQCAVKDVELHLIAPACDASFKKNGLNTALRNHKVSKVFVYYGGKDRAMYMARISKILVGWMGLGYGTLGKTGPKEVDPTVKDRVRVQFEPNFGHSTWFEKRWFDATMFSTVTINN